jgi:hypothetical protein
MYCYKFDVKVDVEDGNISFRESKCSDPGCEYCSSRPEVLPNTCLDCLLTNMECNYVVAN